MAALGAAAPAHAGLAYAPAYTDSSADPVATKNPIYVTAPPGDSSRLFVVERAGRIRVAVGGVIQDTPFLDISSQVQTAGEGGLLSMAFPSDYATSGRFFVYFVHATDGHIHIEQFTRSGANPNVGDPATETLLLDIAHPTYTNHYGGQLQWGPGNLLYAGTGDGGGANDPGGNAQNTSSMLGKLLSIDPATPGTATVVASGLRNPFRWSFDRTDPNIVIGDVGQDAQEEIDWVPTASLAGSNFGWSCWEGTNHRTPSCNPANYVPPVYTYVNGAASAAITGGVVVRDSALTPLYGRYVYADSYAGLVHSQVLAVPNSTDDRLESELPKVDQIVAFGQDADAHVYVVSLFGPVYRITYTPPPASGGGGGGGSPPPPNPAPAPVGEPPPAAPPLPAAPDTRAALLRVRFQHVQDVIGRGRVRFALSCDEHCVARATGSARRLALRGVVQRLDANRRVVFELRASKRIRRALRRAGKVALSIRARDDAGNLSTRSLTIRVRR